MQSLQDSQFALASRHRQFIKDYPDDRSAGFSPGIGFPGDGVAAFGREPTSE